MVALLLMTGGPSSAMEKPAVTTANIEKAPGDTPSQCSAYTVPGMIQQLGCAYVVGYANVTKLNGAAVLGVPDPGLVSVVIVSNRSYCVPSTIPLGLCVIRGGVRHTETGYQFMLEPNDITPGMREGEFPPAPATFLTFGFMPVSATMHLSQIGPIKGVADTTQANGQPTLITTTLSGKVWFRLSDVKVNGVPMDVGPNCRTVEPEDDNLFLGGNGNNSTIPPSGYTVARGGPLPGRVTIPRFTGCVGATGEDLNQLFTGPLSGPDNYVKMTQGNLCSPETAGNNGCPPEIPVPER